MNASEPLIHLDGVTKVFVTDEVETHALAGIHIDIARGEYVSISGPSGCGKSTLLAILGLLDSPSSGTYILNGKPVQSYLKEPVALKPFATIEVFIPTTDVRGGTGANFIVDWAADGPIAVAYFGERPAGNPAS